MKEGAAFGQGGEMGRRGTAGGRGRGRRHPIGTQGVDSDEDDVLGILRRQSTRGAGFRQLHDCQRCQQQQQDGPSREGSRRRGLPGRQENPGQVEGREDRQAAPEAGRQLAAPEPGQLAGIEAGHEDHHPRRQHRQQAAPGPQVSGESEGRVRGQRRQEDQTGAPDADLTLDQGDDGEHRQARQQGQAERPHRLASGDRQAQAFCDPAWEPARAPREERHRQVDADP